MRRQSLDGLSAGQVGTVLEPSQVAAAFLVEMKAQIELGDLQIEMKAADLQVTDSRGSGGQDLQHDLKDGVAAGIPCKGQVFHHGFERQVARGKGIERRPPAPSQQLNKLGSAAAVAPQRRHVEKIPDERLELA